MGTSTTTFPLTVQSAQATLLDTIAAALSPGQWSTSLGTGYQFLGISSTPKVGDFLDSWGGTGTGAWPAHFAPNPPGSNSTLSGNAGPYTSTGWDEQTGLWHCAGTTGSRPFSQSITRYNPATDTFSKWQGANAADNLTAIWPSGGGAHNFGQTFIDPIDKRLYRLLTAKDLNANEDVFFGWVYLDDLVAGQDRSTARRGTSALSGYSALYLDPVAFFPTQRRAIVMNWGGSSWGNFNVATGAWETLWTGLPSVVATMPRLPARVVHDDWCYIAANMTGNAFYRFNASGTFEQLDPTPVVMNGWSYNDQTYQPFSDIRESVQMVALGNYIYAFRPGDVLGVGNTGEIYRYNITTDAWDAGSVGTLVQHGASELAVATNSQINFFNYSACAIPSNGSRPDCVIWMQNRGALVNTTQQDRVVVWRPPA